MRQIIISEEQVNHLSNLLYEIKLPDAKVKFYANIDDDIFNTIVSMDKSGGDNMTPLRNWLLLQYQNGNLTNNNMKQYYDLCNKFNALPSQTRNQLNNSFKVKSPNAFKNIEDFSSAMEGVLQSGQNTTKSQKVQGDTIIIYDSPEWKVLIPTTYKAANKWTQGIGAHWCTGAGTNGNHNGSRMFNHYTNKPPRALVIFMNKQQYNLSYQIAQDAMGVVTDCMDYDDDPVPVDDIYKTIGVDSLERMVASSVREHIDTRRLPETEIEKKLKAAEKWSNTFELFNVNSTEALLDIFEDADMYLENTLSGGRTCYANGIQYLFLYDVGYTKLCYYGPIRFLLPGRHDNGDVFAVNTDMQLMYIDRYTLTDALICGPLNHPDDVYYAKKLANNAFSLRISEGNCEQVYNGLKYSDENIFALAINGKIFGDTSFKLLEPINDNLIRTTFNDQLEGEKVTQNILDINTGQYLIDNNVFDKCFLPDTKSVLLCRYTNDKTKGRIFLPGYGMTGIEIQKDGIIKSDVAKFYITLNVNEDFIEKCKKDPATPPEVTDVYRKYINQKLVYDISNINEGFGIYDVTGKKVIGMKLIDGKYQFIVNESKKKKKTPSIYDQVKKVNSVYMSQAAGIGGILGENDATDDQYKIGGEMDAPIGGVYYHVNEERGVNLSDNTDAIDSLIQQIISNISKWETPENQVDITTSNAVSGIRRDAPKTLTQRERKLNLQTSEGDIKLIQRIYKFDVPEEITSQIPFIAKMKMSIQAIDYTPINPDDIEKLKRVLSSRSTRGGYGNGKYTKVGPDGKTNYATSNFTIQTVNGEVVNPSSVYGIIYHEIGHAKTDNMQMSRGEDKMGSNPVDFWSHQHNSHSMNNGLEYEKAFAVLIYRFWEPDEMNQGAAQVFGDLKGLGNADSSQFNDSFKKTDTGKELELLRHAYDVLSSKPEWSQSVWDKYIVPKYNDREGFLRFRSSASIYNKEKGSWVNVSPRNKTLTFQQFMKQTKKKMNDYIRRIGRSASLYYDRINEETNPENVDLSSFDIQNKLNSKFWKDNHLDSRIRMKLLDIADDFWDTLEINWVEPEDIVMTGSLANYNWNKQFSDIDLHIMIDYKKVDKKTSFVKEYFLAKKNLWNEEHEDLSICGYPVEVYVQDIKEKHESTGVYSLDKDKWIIEPSKKEIESGKIDKEEIKKQVAEYIDRIEEVEQNFNDAKTEYDFRKVSEKSEELFKAIKKERTDGFEESDGKELNNGNIIFKSLRRLEYLDKLYDIRVKSYDKMNSINESNTNPIAYMMIGIPGSGKSTWIKNNHPELPVVSRDIIRGELGFSSGADEKMVGTPEQENQVTKFQREKMKSLATQGKSFIVDDTNTNPKFRKQMVDFLHNLNMKVVFVKFNTDLETCIKRREGQIPADIMKRIHDKFVPPVEGEYDDIIDVL